ncbi:MAG: hypothetical protein N4A53_10295 [Pelagimonas sp.]|jgi:hypothetical protein|nr:hypothetical protein [Pelagimonas sp.]
MIKGFKLYVYAVRMVLRNWLAISKVSIAPIAAAIFVLYYLLPKFFKEGEQTGINFVLFFFVFIVLGFLMVVVVVWWHRFVLLEDESDGHISSLPQRAILAYIGRLILLVIIAMLVSLPLLFLSQRALQIAGVFAVVFLLWPLVYILLASVFLRMSFILPAAAVGKPISIAEAMEDTRGSFWVFLSATVCAAVVQFVADHAVNWLIGLASGSVAYYSISIFSLLVSAMVAMFNVSLLTTLYGHYIEGRPID